MLKFPAANSNFTYRVTKEAQLNWQPRQIICVHLAFAGVRKPKQTEQPDENNIKPHQRGYVNEAECFTEFLNNIQ